MDLLENIGQGGDGHGSHLVLHRDPRLVLDVVPALPDVHIGLVQ